jgi:gas vesicle protein
MSNDNTDFGAFLAGFVLGGLVGAAAALILAPQSGIETRNQLREQSQAFRTEYQHKAQEYLHEARQQVGHTTRPNTLLNDPESNPPTDAP